MFVGSRRSGRFHACLLDPLQASGDVWGGRGGRAGASRGWRRRGRSGVIGGVEWGRGEEGLIAGVVGGRGRKGRERM